MLDTVAASQTKVSGQRHAVKERLVRVNASSINSSGLAGLAVVIRHYIQLAEALDNQGLHAVAMAKL